MEFASIGSGSKGNGTLVRYKDCLLLIDCGFSIQETIKRLNRLGVDPTQITALLVTHEHGDHAKGIGPLARKYNIPVYMTHGTHRACRKLDKVCINWIVLDSSFEIEELSILPVTVPHDAQEPCQFVIASSAGHQLGILSDCGHVTRHMVHSYENCHALMLECNHDLNLLKNGSYPPSLKKRVAGHYGHLNNEQSGKFIQAVQSENLKRVCMTHLSEKNNDPELAAEVISSVLDPGIVLDLALQDQGLDWHRIELN